MGARSGEALEHGALLALDLLLGVRLFLLGEALLHGPQLGLLLHRALYILDRLALRPARRRRPLPLEALSVLRKGGMRGGTGAQLSV